MSGAEREVDVRELAREAARLLERTRSGQVVWLHGELGSGKTAFVRALVTAAGGTDATSPTFSLVQQYETDEGVLYHADCYRLRDEDEAIDLDLFQVKRDGRLLLIEWAERAGPNAPPPDITVKLEHTGNPLTRRLEVVYGTDPRT